MEPGDTVTLETEKGSAMVKAVAGSVIGPPWQAPENGYLFKPRAGSQQANQEGGIFYEVGTPIHLASSSTQYLPSEKLLNARPMPKLYRDSISRHT